MNRYIKSRLAFFLILSSLLLRLYSPAFPYFTADEARLAYRGFQLMRFGVDELGRKMPVLFNSLSDYQLPMTSYFTAIGTVFGKNDFLVRAPFMLLSLGLVWLVYRVTLELGYSRKISFLSALTIAISPVLIYISRVPSQALLLSFLFTLLFFVLIKKRLNYHLVFLLELLIIATSKNGWFVLVPFVFIALYYLRRPEENLVKKKILCMTVIVCISAFAWFFFFIPQSHRSLKENNFPIFSDITISNGINRLRGAGIEYGWSPLIEKILLNKSYFFVVGSLHWISSLQPAVYFGEFDPIGVYGFVGLGAFPKILIIPALLGLVLVVKEQNKKKKLLYYYPLILTFPAFFQYPAKSYECMILTLPFVAIIIAQGFTKINRIVSVVIIVFAVAEVLVNLLHLGYLQRASGVARPAIIKSIISRVNTSDNFSTVISDDITADVVPLVLWHLGTVDKAHKEEIDYPYRFIQTKVEGVNVITSESSLIWCEGESLLILSARDVKRLPGSFDGEKDNFKFDGRNVYRTQGRFCIQ